VENKMIANLKENTGKSLEDWVKIVRKTKLEKHGEIIKFLKTDHGFTHGFANLVAHKARESDAGSHDADDLITSQYEGKEELYDIYNSIMKEVQKFGDDLEVAPKKAYVSLRRKKQFALIQPSTKTRLDVGINIKGKESQDRLETSGSWNTMVSHRVRLESKSEVNKELVQWIKEAYEAAG
jgi:predicted transport protein